jgi:hypothetical protein
MDQAKHRQVPSHSLIDHSLVNAMESEWEFFTAWKCSKSHQNGNPPNSTTTSLQQGIAATGTGEICWDIQPRTLMYL